jgi:hypothetical protein
MGPTGATAMQGPTGATGPTGITGATGATPTAAIADLFATGTPLLPPGLSINFNTMLMCSPAAYSCSPGSVTVLSSGLYKVSYTATLSLSSSTGSLSLFVDGVAVVGGQVPTGAASGVSTAQVSNSVVVQLNAGDFLQVVNTSPSVLQIGASASPTSSAGSLLIEKLQ